MPTAPTINQNIFNAIYALFSLFHAHHVRSAASIVLIHHISRNGVSALRIDNIPNENILIATPNPSKNPTHLSLPGDNLFSII
jgi:hypothetical protein